MNITGDTIQSSDPGKDQPVLVATDFSEDSKAALIWACKFAGRNHAPLILLHVVHDPVSSPGFYRKTKEDQMLPMQTVAESMMADFLDELRSEQPGILDSCTLDFRLVPGLPPSRIVEVATLLEAGLVVVGSRGITGLPHTLLGSTAERVVELSPVPVVVVKSGEHGKNGKKNLKRKKKRQKKDRRKLKKLLGLAKEDVSDNADG